MEPMERWWSLSDVNVGLQSRIVSYIYICTYVYTYYLYIRMIFTSAINHQIHRSANLQHQLMENINNF